MPTKRNFQCFLGLMVACAFFSQNCATIGMGTSQEIPVTSNPAGAKIIVDGKEMGNSPITLKLKRYKSHNIRIEKQGYNPFEVIITRRISLVLFSSLIGNYLLGGISGGILGVIAGERDFASLNRLALMGWGAFILYDIITGCVFEFFPETVFVTLSRIEDKSEPNLILIDANKFQNIKWIRIKFADSNGENRILNLDHID
jgi:hypothetical protein